MIDISIPPRATHRQCPKRTADQQQQEGESASLIEAITCENHHVFHIDIGSILVTNPSLCAGSAHCFHEEEKHIFTNYLKSEPHNTPVGDHNDGRGDKGVIHNLTKRTCLPDFASQNGKGEVNKLASLEATLV